MRVVEKVGPMGCPAGLLFVNDTAIPVLIVLGVEGPGLMHEELACTAQVSVDEVMSPLVFLPEGLPVDICMQSHVIVSDLLQIASISSTYMGTHPDRLWH